MAKIGFIGLGHMGLPMAINLVNKGHHVLGFDIQESACTHFINAGGLIAKDIAALAQEQEYIITMLQSGAQVEQVWLGEQGILAHATPGTIGIDCSTIDCTTSRALQHKACAQQIDTLDAPVSGGVLGAQNAALTFMVGGLPTTFAKAQAILECMGKKIIYAGGYGDGLAAKICNNMILGISMIAVSEAFILAKELGLSAAKLFEVVGHSSGQCWVMSHYPPLPDLVENVPANHNYQPGFAAAMMLKDLSLSQSSAASHQVHTPLAAKTTKLYQQFIDLGHSQVDFSAIIKMIASLKEED